MSEIKMSGFGLKRPEAAPEVTPEAAPEAAPAEAEPENKFVKGLAALKDMPDTGGQRKPVKQWQGSQMEKLDTSQQDAMIAQGTDSLQSLIGQTVKIPQPW